MARNTTSHETARKPAPRRVCLASGIEVHCHFDEIAAAASLKPHPKNAHRKHPPKQLDRFELVIKGRGKKRGNGWRRAIVVSKMSGFIVRGHGAYLMALRRGWDVPIEYQDYASEREELRDLLADNKLAELAETDDAALARLLSEIEDEIEQAGFDPSELDRLLRQTDEPEAEFPITAKLGERYDYCVIFTSNETDFLYLQNLLGLGQEKSYKQATVGLGRAIPFDRALVALRANRHTFDVQGGNHDHPPARAARPGVRSAKPGR